MVAASEQLCAACGMCCTGGLYAHISLEPTEVGRVSRHLAVVQREGRHVVPQPCAAHDGNGCSKYDQRPTACADYRCRVLRRVQGGELALADGLGIVSRASKLALELTVELQAVTGGKGQSGWLWGAVAQHLASAPTAVAPMPEPKADDAGAVALEAKAWLRVNARLLLRLEPLRALCRDELDPQHRDPCL